MAPTSMNQESPGFGSPTGPTDYAKLVKRIKELSCKAFGCEVELVGQHPAFLEAVVQLERFAMSDEPVLITGETGVGKDLFARALHVLNSRHGNFIPVNCARFGDENLIMGELFGHLKGSFTGAIADRPGVFEAAENGTIQLDEVGELCPNAQTALLRVVDQKEIRPVGSTQSRHVDIRIVSTTNCDLRAMVESGEFREDLWYRLSPLPLRVPSLRERGDDWILLLKHFLKQASLKYGAEKELSPDAFEYLRRHELHGNVRELKGFVEAGYCRSSDRLIRHQDLIESVQRRRGCDAIWIDLDELYNRMVEKGETFQEVVAFPYLDRDLNRQQARTLIAKGLKIAGNLKELCRLFNVPDVSYKNFLNFLNYQDLKPCDLNAESSSKSRRRSAWKRSLWRTEPNRQNDLSAE